MDRLRLRGVLAGAKPALRRGEQPHNRALRCANPPPGFVAREEPPAWRPRRVFPGRNGVQGLLTELIQPATGFDGIVPAERQRAMDRARLLPAVGGIVYLIHVVTLLKGVAAMRIGERLTPAIRTWFEAQCTGAPARGSTESGIFIVILRAGAGYLVGVNGPRVQEVLGYFSSNVRRLRLERGLTQEALAEAIGIELRSLQRIEAARANPSITVLVNLADVLGVKPGELLEEAERPVIKRGRPKKIGTL